MRVLILLLITTVSFAQPLTRAKDGAIWYHQKEYVLNDGGVYRYVTDQDTARYFNPGPDQYEITVTAKKKAPPVIMIEAESAPNIVGAAVAPGGGIVCCIQPGAKITYKEQDLAGKTKVKFRYARGNLGNGTLTMKIGNGTAITLTFPNTGNNIWTNFAEVEFVIPPNSAGSIVLTSAMQGAADLDWMEFK